MSWADGRGGGSYPNPWRLGRATGAHRGIPRGGALASVLAEDDYFIGVNEDCETCPWADDDQAKRRRLLG